MKLKLVNIAKVKNADINIDGITVIAGENNSGKSTLGEALYASFNGLHNMKNKMFEERSESIRNIIELAYRNSLRRITRMPDFEETVHTLINSRDEYKNNKNKIKELLANTVISNYKDLVESLNTSILNNISLQIAEILAVSDEDIVKSVLTKTLNAEFHNQINNVFTNCKGSIALQIRGEVIEISVEENKVTEVKDQVDIDAEAIYIDDPFVIDEQLSFWNVFPSYGSKHHRMELIKKLHMFDRKINVVNEIVANQKLKRILDKISMVSNGAVIDNKQNGLGYLQPNSEAILDVSNLSTGLKTFVILKKLLMDGFIQQNGTIILDEPEIHLHPEWQVFFAEIIVLMQKEFGLHVLLNTHSPYFLRAIEVYSNKYKIADRCNYYSADNKGDYAEITNVNKSIAKIYAKLSSPFQKLEDERWSDD